MAALLRAVKGLIKAPNVQNMWITGPCLNSFRYCSSSNLYDISEVLDDIPDVLFSALRLGPTGCSVGQQNHNSFTSGFIDVQLLINQNTKNAVGTTMKSVFSESIHNIKNGRDLKKYEIAIGKLNKFLKNKDYHEECFIRGIDKALEAIETNKSSSSFKHSVLTQTVVPEGTVAALLAIHLLSQLTASDYGLEYVVTDDYKSKPEFCPCGCDLQIIYGSTLIGSVDLFYGRPDILLFPEEKECVVSIMFPAKQITSPVPKSRTNTVMTREKPKFVEVKNNEQTLPTDSTFSQIALQTITFSFFHRIFHEREFEIAKDSDDPDFRFKSSLVPTIEICNKGFNICMYDSINDIFIKNHGPPIQLFHPDDQTIRISSIVYLWLAINHSIFHPNINENEKLLQGSFGLISRYVNRDIYERIKDSMDLDVDFKEKNKLRKWGQYNVDILSDLESVDYGENFKKLPGT